MPTREEVKENIKDLRFELKEDMSKMQSLLEEDILDLRDDNKEIGGLCFGL